MNKELLALLNQPFLADKQALKTLFELAMSSDLKANTNVQDDFSTNESENIHIHGVMWRYKNIFTEFGWGVSTEEITKKIEASLKANKHVNLIIDSGGGVVNGMSEFAGFIHKNKKHITTYVKGYCASAAFWAGSSAGKLYVEDTSMIGSVGVVVTLADFSKMYEDWGITIKDITSTQSPNKRVDIKTQKGENEVRRQLDGLADIFIGAVAKNRNMSNDEIVKKLENGGVITGLQAVERGIADGVKPINLHTKEKNMAKEKPIVEKDVDKTPQEKVVLDESANEAKIKELKAQNEALIRERERNTTFSLFPTELTAEDKALLIEQDANAVDVTNFIANKRAEATVTVPPILVGEDLSKKSLHEDIENALVLGMGESVENASDRSMKLANGSIKAIIGGYDGLTFGNSDMDFMSSMTTTEFPLLLTRAVNRVLVSTFEAQPTTYDQIVEKVAHRDFKPHQDVELQNIQPTVFKEIVEGGELKAFTTQEKGEISAIATYGAKYSLSRKLLINDDLGAFAGLFKGFGYASKHLINSLVYQLLEGRGAFESYTLDDGQSFFHASRKNIANVAGAISKNTISAGRTALGRQTDKFGEPKVIMPEFILTPLELQTDAETFLNSTSIVDTSNANIANVFKNKFRIITDARLENANAWYMGTKGAIKLGYLNQTKAIPQIEITNKNKVDGIEYSCLIDFKVYAGDPKRIYKNLGV